MRVVNQLKEDTIQAKELAKEMIKHLNELINSIKGTDLEYVNEIEMSDIKNLIYHPGETDNLAMKLKITCKELHDRIVSARKRYIDPLKPKDNENTIISV